MRRLIALLALLPTVASSQAVCSTVTQSETTCSAVEQSITTTSACECVASVAAPAGPFGGHATLTDGLVSYWPLDEESGTRVDIVGTNDLTDNNTVGFASVTGPPNFPTGKAASFVEANFEYLSHIDDATLRVGTGDFTFSFWYYPTEAELDIILNKGGQEDYTFDTNAGGIRFYFKNGGTYPTATWGSSPALNTWHHVIGWRSSGDSAVYIQVDGGTPVSAATGAIVDSDTAGAFAIGAVPGGGFSLQGKMSSVAFWSRVLTAQERTDLYNSGAGLFYED